MRSVFSLSVVAFLALTLGACQEQPTPLDTAEPEVMYSHGASDDARMVTVELKETNNSGITGQATITDDGTEVTVTGSASDMDPDNAFDPEGEPPTGYLSLFYDKASTPAGPRVCEPGVGEFGHSGGRGLGEEHPLHLTDAQMLGGFWIVDANGDGTLVDLEGAYVPVDEIGTMSIRDLRINGGFGPDAVVACGKVTHDPAS